MISTEIGQQWLLVPANSSGLANFHSCVRKVGNLFHPRVKKFHFPYLFIFPHLLTEPCSPILAPYIHPLADPPEPHQAQSQGEMRSTCRNTPQAKGASACEIAILAIPKWENVHPRHGQFIYGLV